MAKILTLSLQSIDRKKCWRLPLTQEDAVKLFGLGIHCTWQRRLFLVGSAIYNSNVCHACPSDFPAKLVQLTHHNNICCCRS